MVNSEINAIDIEITKLENKGWVRKNDEIGLVFEMLVQNNENSTFKFLSSLTEELSSLFWIEYLYNPSTGLMTLKLVDKNEDPDGYYF